jgi:uncharacterized repeat protein (TIGR01451 family)
MVFNKRIRKFVSLLCAGMLLFSLIPGQTGVPAAIAAPVVQTPPPAPNASTTGRKIVVDNADSAALSDVKKNGGQLIADYGSFSLWRVGQTSPTPQSASVQSVGGDFDTLYLRGAALDTRQPLPNVPARLAQSLKAGENALWLVQLVGPVKPDWLDSLRKSGLEPVSYVPNNAYIVWGSASAIQNANSLAGIVQWNGAYHPAYRLAPELNAAASGKNSAGNLTVTVQFYTTGNTNNSLAALQTISNRVVRTPYRVMNLTNVTVDIAASRLSDIAGWADVLNIEKWVAPAKHDEVQNQVIAGNLTTTGDNRLVPSSPGYLAWLQTKGFPTDPTQYPVVAVVDDGVDNGTNNPLHPDFHENGVLANPSRLVFNTNCSTDGSAAGNDGHGNINAGIVGSYNSQTTAPHQDAQGYNRGQGVAPYTRLGNIKIFGPGFSTQNCLGLGSSEYSRIAQAAADQAVALNAPVFTTQSWGSDVAGGYDTGAQEFDALTRDANLTTAGNQQMLHIFSAGNEGPGSATIGSPGTAKNVLTVGATENVRDDGILDGCFSLDSNNVADIADFSSRGPTVDLRAKPDLVAPGVHVQGPASQSPGYNGTGICGGLVGGVRNPYYPNFPQSGITQTLYTWSTGTSHSTPAVAGAASLVFNYYKRVLSPGQEPTPAMLKALLVNTPRYLDGLDSGGSLPHPNQGWGGMSLARLFDGTAHSLVNQSFTLPETGAAYSQRLSVQDTGKPVHITLAWTDAPGSTVAASYVNDLDLEVLVNGQLYRGNNFSGANSVPGGQADKRNNLENVFLPAGTSGTIVVRVKAANLAGDAIPGSGTTTDQDFALVAYNTTTGGAAVAQPGLDTYTLSDAPGDNDGIIEPGETVSLTVRLRNDGSLTATNVTSNLSAQSGVTVTTGSSAYPDIPFGARASNTTPYVLQIGNTIACNQPVVLTQTVNYAGGGPVINQLVFQTGNGQVTPIGPAVTYTSTNFPRPISDLSPNLVQSYLSVPGSSAVVGKIRVKVKIKHTYTGDLTLRLLAPDGTTVTLANQRGGMGDDYTDTIFDDSAATLIGAGTAPFTGTYRPDQPLSAFTGKSTGGVWKLAVNDAYDGDGGELTGWSLEVTSGTPTCGQGGIPLAVTPNATQQTSVNHTFPVAPSVQLNGAGGGKTVTFTVEDSAGGASATFAGGGKTFSAMTDANGRASAPVLTANGTPGNYRVNVSADGYTAQIGLENMAANSCNEVSNAMDDGTGMTCGTLSYALRQPVPSGGVTVTFAVSGNKVTFSGLPAGGLNIPDGVKLQGTSCASPLVLDGNNQAGGLVLTGSATLQNVQIGNFGGVQLSQSAGAGRLIADCVVVRHKL